MPTVKRFGNCKISVYAQDHGQPHFHIDGPDVMAVVTIEGLRVLHGDVRTVREAMDWAAENKGLLLDAWRALNGRG